MLEFLGRLAGRARGRRLRSRGLLGARVGGERLMMEKGGEVLAGGCRRAERRSWGRRGGVGDLVMRRMRLSESAVGKHYCLRLSRKRMTALRLS